MLSLHPESRPSILSSLSFAPGLGSDYLSNNNNAMANSGAGADLRRSLWGSGFGGAVLPSSYAGLQTPLLLFQQQQQDEYYSEDMSFLVEMPPSLSEHYPFGGSQQQKQSASSNTKPSGSASASSYLGNSSALASLAQKCAAPSPRLKLSERPEKLQHPSDAAENVAAARHDNNDDDLANS